MHLLLKILEALFGGVMSSVSEIYTVVLLHLKLRKEPRLYFEKTPVNQLNYSVIYFEKTPVKQCN
jgi:hypothetical protein